MENDFILPLEKEVFIEQLKDIVDKAEDMLSEETEGERTSDRGSSPKKSEGADVHGAEVRERLLTVRSFAGGLGASEERQRLRLYQRARSTTMTRHATLPKIPFLLM